MNLEKFFDLSDKLEHVGQEHLALYLHSLKEKDQNSFIDEIRELDFERLEKAWKNSSPELIVEKNNKYDPIKSLSYKDKACLDYQKIGIKIISENKTAICIMSGGMGSRLGFDGPKGTFMLTPEKSLFQIHIESLKKVSKLTGVFPLVLIMTSKLNHENIIAFFEENNFFSYPKDRFVFFRQGEIPAFDKNGKILLSHPNKIMTAPDGNGGIFRALVNEGVMDILSKEKIEWLHVVGVDNVLTKHLDPVFIGYTEYNNFEISSKSVGRDDPYEKVGLIVLKNSKPSIVEYTELPEDLRYSKTNTGNFVYDEANIASHLFNVDALSKKLNKDLPYHRAYKKLEYYKDGKYHKSDTPNAYKLEQFLFDIFPYYSKMGVYQVEREKEFSPLKNKAGKDSVETARYSYLRYGVQNGYL